MVGEAQPHLAQVCRGAWLGQLIEQVASEPAQLARRLCELLRVSPAPPRALDALCTYESLMALLLHVLTRLHAAHADGGDGGASAAALAAALHASGSLRLLARAPFLELSPRHLGDDAGADGCSNRSPNPSPGPSERSPPSPSPPSKPKPRPEQAPRTSRARRAARRRRRRGCSRASCTRA